MQRLRRPSLLDTVNQVYSCALLPSAHALYILYLVPFSATDPRIVCSFPLSCAPASSFPERLQALLQGLPFLWGCPCLPDPFTLPLHSSDACISSVIHVAVYFRICLPALIWY